MTPAQHQAAAGCGDFERVRVNLELFKASPLGRPPGSSEPTLPRLSFLPGVAADRGLRGFQVPRAAWKNLSRRAALSKAISALVGRTLDSPRSLMVLSVCPTSIASIVSGFNWRPRRGGSSETSPVGGHGSDGCRLRASRERCEHHCRSRHPDEPANSGGWSLLSVGSEREAGNRLVGKSGDAV